MCGKKDRKIMPNSFIAYNHFGKNLLPLAIHFDISVAKWKYSEQKYVGAESW